METMTHCSDSVAFISHRHPLPKWCLHDDAAPQTSFGWVVHYQPVAWGHRDLALVMAEVWALEETKGPG